MTDLLTSDFAFDLPPELIAPAPARPRDAARLLHVTPAALADRQVHDLPGLLRAGDLMVFNDTRVIPSRLIGWRGDVRVETLLHKHAGGGLWLAFARPGKRLRAGDDIIFAPDIRAKIMEKWEGGELALEFSCSHAGLLAFMQAHGHMPLPPYIKRAAGDTAEDRADYQTVYAARDGAVAAPTAGLHFTPELLAALDAKGIERMHVTLHVGAGTFLPVKAARIADHVMHAEWGEVTPENAARLLRAKQEGRRIVAVGTTAARLLETAARGGAIAPFAGETDIFIYPGFAFRAVDALMTNFHLPESTLFMLVSAFAGRDRMQAAYRHAIERRYRFFSYGDATLLERA
ncbi:MAG: tRNA preQ1(34) S-adenosylmethionine ribosyltransferase-isomerase QueA [Alphaproteobacteria bacterium]|nr:tRNA preQ1(34) S-adenosylmethionine ribosyltransferase-isomerase QueA [Alphaproteobacteria bacterium]